MSDTPETDAAAEWIHDRGMTEWVPKKVADKLERERNALSEQLNQLVEHWERRTIAADRLANDAAGAGEWTKEIRCKAKAGTIRAMTVEIKRAIKRVTANQ